MVIKRNLNIKRKGRSNPRRNGFSRHSNFENKPKGNVSKILERYLSLARDANSNGDKIKAEGFYQYAEHYQRVINAQPIKNSTKIDKSRKNSPLVKVNDAILIKTDKLSKKKVLSLMSKHIENLN